MTYNDSATQNNGRIVSSSDAVTGETVSYTYDALNRLIAAANPQVDPYTNRARVIGDYGFDANGNWLCIYGPQGNLRPTARIFLPPIPPPAVKAASTATPPVSSPTTSTNRSSSCPA